MFDAREYDSFLEARSALLEMIHRGLYEDDSIFAAARGSELTRYTLINDAGETRTGTVRELSDSFGYSGAKIINQIIRGNYPKSGKTVGWRLAR